MALDAVHVGQVASVEVALKMLRDQGALPVHLEAPTPRAGEREALARAVAAEIVGELRADLQGLRDENAALRLEVAALRAELSPDRLRIVAHAAAPAPARPVGWRGLLHKLLDPLHRISRSP